MIRTTSVSRSRARISMAKAAVLVAFALSLTGVGAVAATASSAVTLSLPNSGFESTATTGQPTGWAVDRETSPPSGTQACSAAVAAPKALSQPCAVTSQHSVYRGHRSLQISSTFSDAIHVRSAKLPTKPGYEHRVRIQVATDLGAASTDNESPYGPEPANVVLEFWNRAGKRIDFSIYQPPVDGSWRRATVSKISPPGTAAVSLMLDGAWGSGGVSYFDDAAVVRSAEPTSPPTSSSKINSRKQLFFDDDRVETQSGVTRVTHRATKQGPVLTGNTPWEDNKAYVFGTVIDESDRDPAKRYKMWYQAYDGNWCAGTVCDKPPCTAGPTCGVGKYLIMYATSPDGVRWTKPKLHKFMSHGSSANNILFSGVNPTVVRDTADPDPSRRYKMTLHEYTNDTFETAYGLPTYAFIALVSADGITWKPAVDGRILPGGDNIQTVYDPRTRQFLTTWKPRRTMYPDDADPRFSRRVQNMAYSKDFKTWEQKGTVSYSDGRDDRRAARVVAQNFPEAPQGAEVHSDVQVFSAAPYEGYYIGLADLYQQYLQTDGKSNGNIEIGFAYGKDPLHFNRDDRTVVIPNGRSEADFDHNLIFTGSAPVRVGDELWWYYGGWTGGGHGTLERSAAVGIAKWRLDGFVSRRNAGPGVGAITTKPVTFTGNTLRVNAKLKRGGSIRAELLDARGRVIRGFDRSHSVAFTGDDVAHAMSWKGKTRSDLAALAGSRVKVRLYLDEGDIYAYQFVRAS